MLYLKMMTRNRTETPLPTKWVALFPAICSWHCTSSAPEGLLGMNRREEAFPLHSKLTLENGGNDTERRGSGTDPNAFLIWSLKDLTQGFYRSLERLVNLIVRKSYLTFSLILLQPISLSYSALAQPKKQFLTFSLH